MKLIVCDDDRIFCHKLTSRISQIKDYGEISIRMYTDGRKLLKHYTHCDALLLDIQIPGFDGFEIAKKINEQDKDVKIIFITNHDEMVYKCFEYSPFRFLRKRYVDNELMEVLSAVNAKCERDHHFVRIKLKEGYTDVKADSIKYIDIYNRIINVHLRDNTELVSYGDLASLEAELNKMGFVRTNRSYLVNMQYIDSLAYNFVILDDKTRIPLSRGRKDKVTESLHRYVSDFD